MRALRGNAGCVGVSPRLDGLLGVAQVREDEIAVAKPHATRRPTMHSGSRRGTCFCECVVLVRTVRVNADRASFVLAIAGARRAGSPTSPIAEPPAFRIVVEPDTVRTRLTAQQRIQLDFVVRIFNDGPGRLFVPSCGHEVQRFAPNATWIAVFHPPCPPDYGPPYALEIGETYGYIVRILVSGDSGPWRRGQIGGRYRTVSYISSEYRASGAWGRPVPFPLRLSPEFPVREEVP